jgi:hypothetical protein
MTTKIITVQSPAPAESAGADVNKGAPLNAAEFDQNLVNLRAALDRKKDTAAADAALAAKQPLSSATTAQLNHLVGVTSPVQGQINGKAPTVNPLFSGPVLVNAHLTPTFGVSTPLGFETNAVHTVTAAGIYSNMVATSVIDATGNSSAVQYSLQGDLEIKLNSPFNYNSLGGMYANISHNGLGTVTQLRGNYVNVKNINAGTVTSINGYMGIAANMGTGTVVTAKAITLQVDNTGGGTITNGYGVYIGPISAANKWSVYASDATAPSYFAAPVTMNTGAKINGLSVYADNAAALAGGKVAGDVYRTATGVLMVTY